MTFLGNLFTYYNYTTTDISQLSYDNFYEVSSKHSDFFAKIKTTDTTPQLPLASPFSDWKSARRFAGPLPFTFTFDALKNEVLIIEGVREDWTPKPVEVIDYHFSFLIE